LNVEKAKNSFLEAKQDLSPRTLQQYSQALDYLQAECPEMPGKPEPLREALNKVPNNWVRDAYWRVWKSFFNWCWPYSCLLDRRERRPKLERYGSPAPGL